MNLNYAGKQSKSVNQNIFTPPCNLVVGIPEHVDVVYLEEKPSCDFIVVTCCDPLVDAEHEALSVFGCFTPEQLQSGVLMG